MEESKSVEEVTPKKKETSKSITYNVYKSLPKDISVIKQYKSISDLYEDNKGKLIYKEKAIIGRIPTLYYVVNKERAVTVCGIESEVKKYL